MGFFICVETTELTELFSCFSSFVVESLDFLKLAIESSGNKNNIFSSNDCIIIYSQGFQNYLYCLNFVKASSAC